MNKHLISHKDGSVSLMTIIDPASTPEKEIAKFHPTERATITSHQPVKENELPDLYFMGAFTPGKIVTIDMKKAQAIHMGTIRLARDKALQALDIQTMMGRDVQAEKQVLRDIPQTFDLTKAKTPSDLKKMWPPKLPGLETAV